MLILESQSLNVYRNLAIEEYLMDREVDSGPVLFLWQSEDAVVMGKNQNPWRECRLDLMRDEEVPLARRISGGGTVYHDRGNLNYCVITERTEYREEFAYEMVFQALRTFGIRAEKTGKSNLSVDGLKFSGNAFSFRKGRALHHGTLLLNTNLERLDRYLGSMFDHIETHAIASVPARVTNLGLDVKELSMALAESFCRLYNGRCIRRWHEADLDEMALQPLVQHQISKGWIYGATPKFSLTHGDVRLEVAKGKVVSVDGLAGDEFLGMSFRELAFLLVC
jgi:lipoate-protein ligase A